MFTHFLRNFSYVVIVYAQAKRNGSHLNTVIQCDFLHI
jgi:hypothetical protein